MVEGIIGFSDMLSIANNWNSRNCGINTNFLKKTHMEYIKSSTNSVLNDLDEKVRKMIEIIIENHQSKKSSINLKNHQMS